MKFLSTLALVLLTSSVMAATTIKGLDYVSTSASEGRLIVKLDGNLKENPMISVKERLIFKPEQYVYSSAIDYAGGKGLLDIILIE